MNKPEISDLGALRCSHELVRDAGSCNFCSDTNDVDVVVVSGRGTQVRFCLECWAELRAFHVTLAERRRKMRQ